MPKNKAGTTNWQKPLSSVKSKSTAIGRLFEQQASDFLVAQGLNILAANYTVPKVGEIDIVAIDGGTLVFVEVKARKSSSFATATESVTFAKQQKIIRTAEHFLMIHDEFAHHDCRFDVIAFDIHRQSSHCQWIQGAFLVA